MLNLSNPVAFVDGQAVLERSHRLEFGIERVLDNSSNVEATAFFDTTSGRGVGFLSSRPPHSQEEAENGSLTLQINKALQEECVSSTHGA